MFAEYITRSGLSRAAWAAKIGISRSYLSDLLNGKKDPSLRVAVDIERLTAGAVPASSWMPEADGQSPASTPSDAA